MASSTNYDFTDSPAKGGAVVSAPRYNASSSTPWTQIVAGDVEEKVDGSCEAAADGSYSGGDVIEGSQNPVWNKPSNGALEVEPVMGADSWPALSEVAKAPHKSSGDSSKSFPETSMLCLQETEPAPSAQKQVSNSPRPKSSQNHASLVRQTSFHRASPARQTSFKPTSHVQKNFNSESAQKVASESRSHGTNDRQRHSNSHRGLNGPHHGDSSYNHRYGARKDQYRPNRDWNSQRSFNGRDVHPQATGTLPRGVTRPISMSHGSASYIAPPSSPTLRPFGPPINYPDFPFYYVHVQPESIRGMGVPYPAPAPHHMFMQMQYLDPELYSKVIYQIDYYFSNENLIKDTFLRKNMDEQGWVPIKLIAGFQKVMKLTDNIAFIMQVIRNSTVVEVKDDKVRRRNDWMKWLMPESVGIPFHSTYLDPGSSDDFAAHIHKININGDSEGTPRATPSSGYRLSQHPSH